MMLKLLSISIIVLYFRCSLVFGQSLYSNSDVVELDRYNFDSIVYDSDSPAYLVNFYVHWCSACVNYAPKWKEFAKRVKSWDSVVKIAAFNCAPKDSWTFCQWHFIRSPTTIRYYPYGSRDLYFGRTFTGQISEKWDLDFMTKYLVDSVKNTARSQFLPRFEPLTNYENIDDVANKQARYVGVVFEYNNHKLADQIILDFSKENSIEIFAASYDHPLLAGNTNSMPALVIYETGNFDSPKYVSQSPMNREEILNVFMSMRNLRSISEENVAHNHESPPRISIAPTLDQQKVHMIDLKSALSFLLHEEIAINSPIKGEKLKSLRRFINLLAKYFPSSDVYVFLNRLYGWTLVQNEIMRAQWQQKIKQLSSLSAKPLPETPTWVTCKGSIVNYRGYSCGLWLLFHTITVEAYVMDGEEPNFDPMKVLLGPIQDYVKYFFVCGDCATHFEKSANRMPKPSKPEDSVLWLWKMHNIANKHLTGKPSEDPLFPKTQYPPKEMCGKCRNSDGKWNETEVLRFIVEMYLTDRVE